MAERGRLFREGLVIVGSILLAFAVDAWWDDLQEHRRAAAHVQALTQEFEALDSILEEYENRGSMASEATRAIAAMAGPNPAWVSSDSLGHLMIASSSVNTLSIPDGALSALLMSGEIATLGDLQLETALAAWPGIALEATRWLEQVEQSRDNGTLLIANRAFAMETALAEVLPESMTPPPHFEYDPIPLLSDREFTNALATRLVVLGLSQRALHSARLHVASTLTLLRDWR